jgi:RNA polymerase sigma-70 factor, ECF subfamily
MTEPSGPRPEVAIRPADPVEAELAARAHAGDLDAFGRLVDRYAAQARRVARAILGDAHDGDDAAQDGFLSALRNLGRYDPNRPFGPRLMRIVSNAAVDRRRRNRVRTTEPLSPGTPTREAGPGAETDRRAFQQALWTALQTLPERQRTAVMLFDVEGYSHAEIAVILRVPQGTVRSDVFHGRRALRSALRPWRDWKEDAQ